jgi:hypothetical protein
MSEGGLFCHCRMNPDGHEPGSVLDCEAPPIRPGRWLRPEIARLGEYAAVNFAKLDARGTCPVCSKNAPVKRIQVFAQMERGRWLPPVENPQRPRGNPFEVRPGMAPHKVKGVQCAGTGQVPAETRYTPGRELAGYLQLLAEEEKSA